MKPSLRLSIVLFQLCLLLSIRSSALEEGAAAPDMQAHLLNGQPFSIEKSRGDVILVHFWATWCKPCMAEMGDFEKYFQTHQKQGFKLIAINIDDAKNEPKVREAMKAYSFPGALGHETNYKNYGRIWKLPVSFLVDRNGILVKKEWDATNGLQVSDLESVVTPLLTKTQ